ncbi:MAG TPA: DUF3105 domain-containing protein [Nannocystaceae bacterium]|nr:DUF3105 domain-containing protein [Nannocystaceae bacterium]
MRRLVLLTPLLFACPADDWHESIVDGGSSSTGAAATATASASTTASVGGTVGDTSGATGGTSGGTAASDDATGADATTGALECGTGLEPSEFTEVEGCAAVIGEPLCSEGQQHVVEGSDVEWQSDPPSSGPHYPTWATYDEHDEVVPRGNWVHNLEHGAIVLGYRCNDDCEPELDVLRDVLAARPELRILLTPDPFLPGDERFSAISWTWIYRFDAPELETLLCFADQHENHAPENIP